MTRQQSLFIDAGAEFDGPYRYRLWRKWSDDGGRVLWVMLNPSIANETILDPTVKKCVGFSKAWGHGSIEVVNIFALVSTDPKAIYKHESPVGPKNDEAIIDAAMRASRIIVAWGTHGKYSRRGSDVVRILQAEDCKVECLGKTQEGFPNHPLYIPYVTRPIEYTI